MTSFLLGCAILFLLLWAAKAFTRGNPRLLAMRGERILGFLILAVVAGFLLAGLWVIALIVLPIMLAALGLHMLWNPYIPSLSVPRFRTRYLDMAVNLRRRHFDAHIREGRFAGADLNTMTLGGLLGLFNEFADDAESCNLLAAYLDRRFPDWREHAHAHAHARQAGAGAANMLSEKEAYEVLGLQEGATLKEIGEAHRRLMKRLHPDTGGTAWLAAKLNAAKELLVKTHYKNSTGRS